MSTNFPTSLDTFVNPGATDLVANANPALVHHTQHDNINDAVAALETKVGVNNSAVSSSIDFKLSTLTTTVTMLTLTGMVTPYAGSTAPTGWKICDGSAISRSTFATLFAVIGTIYGIGDGSTTFNVPDLRGSAPYGLKSSDTNFDALNTPSVYIGEKTHTLAKTEIPAHNHGPYASGGFGGGQPAQVVWSTGGTITSTTSNITGPVAIADSGGSGTGHNNMPPYVVLNYLIKT